MSKYHLGQRVWIKPEFGNSFCRYPLDKVVYKVNTEESIDMDVVDMIGNHPISKEVTYCLSHPECQLDGHYYPENKIFETRLECLKSIREDYNNVVKEMDDEIEKEKENND